MKVHQPPHGQSAAKEISSEIPREDPVLKAGALQNAILNSLFISFFGGFERARVSGQARTLSCGPRLEGCTETHPIGETPRQTVDGARALTQKEAFVHRAMSIALRLSTIHSIKTPYSVRPFWRGDLDIETISMIDWIRNYRG